jgi:hypothetical protein
MTRTILLLCLAASLAPARAGAQDPGWTNIAREDGIAVSMREEPGRDFPTFRGVGVVDGSIFDVLAVLSDIERHHTWMDRCVEARLLRKASETEYIVYSRTDAPWPIADRDAVFHSRAHVDTRRQVVEVRFWAEVSPLKGPVPGVVRMTRLRGYYRLTVWGGTKTLMDYKVDADPAGSIPRWLAKIATKRLPLNTIRNLRQQVKKTRGWYDERIRRWKEMYRTGVVK